MILTIHTLPTLPLISLISQYQNPVAPLAHSVFPLILLFIQLFCLECHFSWPLFENLLIYHLTFGSVLNSSRKFC